jgi:hypothetical protein
MTNKILTINVAQLLRGVDPSAKLKNTPSLALVVVVTVVESKQQGIDRSKRFSAVVSTTVTTTTSANDGVFLSFALGSTPLSNWATLIVSILLVMKRAL